MMSILAACPRWESKGAVVTRTAVLASGLGEEVTGVQLNRFCGSGLESVNTAAAHVAAGART